MRMYSIQIYAVHLQTQWLFDKLHPVQSTETKYVYTVPILRARKAVPRMVGMPTLKAPPSWPSCCIFLLTRGVRNKPPVPFQYYPIFPSPYSHSVFLLSSLPVTSTNPLLPLPVPSSVPFLPIPSSHHLSFSHSPLIASFSTSASFISCSFGLSFCSL
jgi:hypothetical protein